jgi:hypothetical protein
MKKGLLASFMVALMLVTVLSAGLSANAVTVSKKSTEYGKSLNTYTLPVVTCYEHCPPELEFRVPYVWVVIRVEGEEKNRFKQTDVDGYCEFRDIPTGKEYTLISAQNREYVKAGARWMGGYNWFVIEMRSRFTNTIDNPFLEWFPLLNLLLQRLRI